MSKYSYSVVQETFTDIEKNRLIACYLTIADTNNVVNFEAAAHEFGAASAESFKKMINNAFKKLDGKKADGSASVSSMAVGSAKNSTSRKRKAEDNESNGLQIGLDKPTKKSRKSNKKKGIEHEDKVVNNDDYDSTP